MPARSALVHQILVSDSPWTNTKVSSIPASDRSAPRVWFHALLELAMEALERLTHCVTVRGGIIVAASLVAVLMAGRGLALRAT
jgi:hypothetical protein